MDDQPSRQSSPIVHDTPIEWKVGHLPGHRIADCSVIGCVRPIRARGWCDKHYKRWLKHGSTDIVSVPGAVLTEADVAHIRTSNWSTRNLAAWYSVSPGHIDSVRVGRYWTKES